MTQDEPLIETLPRCETILLAETFLPFLIWCSKQLERDTAVVCRDHSD